MNLENQTKADPYMPLRVMGYDGVEFETTINKRKEAKGVRTMSEWLTKVINESQARGLAKGRAEGEFATLVSLVRKNLLSVKDAAEQAGLSEVEFCQKAGLPVQQ